MKKKIILKIISIIFILTLSFFLFSKIFINPKKVGNLEKITETEKKIIQSNIIKDVNYKARDLSGNEYSLYAKEGEINLSNKDFVLLKDIISTIKLSDLSIITITSDFGKYNIINHDTIFNKNVYVVYEENKINGEYLDFSLQRNLISISEKVVFSNFNNTMRADVIEINLKTKDAKIFMKDDNELIKIISKN